jgi:RHS repeat-associated protein
MRKSAFCLLYLALGCGLLLGQSYQGNLDSAGCGSIVGWAWNYTTSPIMVDFYDGTVYVTSMLANQNTGSDSYVDGGYHGFSLPTPATLKDNQIHTIYVRYGGTGMNLGSDPRTIQCDSSSTGYQYYYTDTLQSINTNNWTQNGTLSTSSGWGLNTSSSGSGSLISTVPVQGPSSANYEVNTTLALNASGGYYVQYLRASSNALTGTGSYVSVELQNPTFNATTGACAATLAAFQSINGAVTQLYSTPVVCRDGMQVRTAAVGNAAFLSVDGLSYEFTFSSQLSSGMPGVGVRSTPSTNAISQAELGPWDNMAPSPVNPISFTLVVGGAFVWQGAVDNSDGTGVLYYSVCRTPGSCFSSYSASFEDTTQQPNTTYTYQIAAVDYHGNNSAPTSLTVAVPASGSGTNARPGLRPTNTYWGGAGEQIDVYGGNLNYSVPLISATGRGSLRAAFNLTYNSLNWSVASGTTSWPEGVDVGYGFGWQLMLGSLIPVDADPSGMEYMYTDASGAQYRMVIQNGTVWTGNASFYAWYDSSTNRLWFRDGSFWVMGCVSAGGEPDAGTMYPTVVEDSNGNQIIIHYMPGLGANWNDSSARISTIEDARAVPYSSGGDTLYESYSFSYTTGVTGLSYLSSITSYVGTPENYSFRINQGQGIYSPAGVSFGTTSLLAAAITTGLGYSYNFTYDTTLNDGDLTEVEFPQGGHLRWTYTNCTYPGPVTIREVQYRYLLANAQQGEETYTFTPGNGTSTTLDDASGAERYWVFSGGWLSEIQYRAYPGAPQALRHEYYTWVQDPVSLNFYIGTLETVLNEGQTYAQTTQTVQTQDSYGNVLTTQVYDYGNLNTPARTYSNTYLYQNNTNYSSRYIYNRLLTSTLTSASPNITLASNTYDGYSVSAPNGSPREWDILNDGTTFNYRGNATQANTPGHTILTTYDATGTVTTQNDNNGHSVAASTSALTNFTLPDTLTPNGTTSLQTQATYNSVGFFPASVAGPGQTLNNGSSGTAAYTSYDGYGRVAYTLAPSQVAGQLGAQTNYTYSYASTGWTTTATTANSGGGSHFATTTLDGVGRSASVVTGYNSTTKVSEVDTSYAPCACSPLGKMSQQSQPYLPPNSAPPGTAYSYDALGRTVKVLLADGASYTTYTYQGNFTTITDPAGNWKQYANDTFGNLVTVLEPDPLANPLLTTPPANPPAYPVTTAPTGMLLTSYTYDQVNHLTLVSMPRNTAGGPVTQTRSFVYTPTTYSTLTLPAQWLTSATNPENGTVSYTYNADGTLASKTDAINNTETYTYDAYQRLTAIPDRQQTFTYDTCPTNAMGCVSMAGQLMQATFGSNVGPNELSFEYNYAYTPAGKMSSKTLEVQSANHISMQGVQASGALTASYTYDNQGGLTSAAYPQLETWAVGGVQTFTYTLDAMERPTAMTDSNNYTWATGVTYNPANQMTFDGVKAWTYNNLLQATQAGHMTYNYSASKNNGQITSSVDAVTGETITYQYDLLKRLESASGKNWGETYTYDGFGNMTQMAPSGTAGAPSLSVTVNANTNRLTPSGAQYDNKGNLLTGFPGIELVYDLANRVSEVMTYDQTSYYGYDSDNRRIYYRNGSGGETIYFYGADGKKLATYTYTIITYNGNPEIQLTEQSKNVYFVGLMLTEEGNSVSTDRLGSVRSGGPGGLGYQAEYPYGVEYAVTANDREKYATYTRDSLTGLDYAMNRYYSSQWGRFLSPDPYSGSAGLGDPGSWNRYAYTRNDPVNRLDPGGLQDCQGPCLIWNPYPTPPDLSGGNGETGLGGDAEDGCSVYDPFEKVAGDCSSSRKGTLRGGSAEQKVWQEVSRAVGNAFRELRNNAKCFNFLAGGTSINPYQVLSNIVLGFDGTIQVSAIPNNNKGTVLSAITTVAATSQVGIGNGATQTQNSQVLITINDLQGTFSGGSAYDQQTTLLHELGHAIYDLFGPGGAGLLSGSYGIQPDGSNTALSEANTAKIEAVCP